jgi:hypothetical protein
VVTADGTVNVLVPMSALAGLSVPPSAITDGSADPAWVDVPCTGTFVYGRRRTMRLPFDAVTADIVHRRLRLDRRVRTVWTPVSMALLVAAIATLYVPGDDELLGVLRIALFMAGSGLSFWTDHLGKKVAVAQQPELVGRLGIYLPAVSAPVAREWITRNPTVLAVPQRPRWRRYPSWVYRWAAGVCAVAGVGIWWFALRDGTSSLTALLAFILVVGAAAVLAFKALPVGSIRWDHAA